MTINQTISTIMKSKKMKQKEMALALGVKTQQIISERVRYSNMTFNNAIEMLELLGYEVVVQPRKPGKRPEGQIVIERSNAQ